MEDKIHDFTTLVASSVDGFARRLLQANQRRAPLQFGTIRIGRQENATGTVQAEIEAADFAGLLGWQGRWLARCPADGCMGAEEVTRHEPYFMCLSCFNRDNASEWINVNFPRDRAQIEATLLKRPRRNRNYKPGETLSQLRAENKSHGFEE